MKSINFKHFAICLAALLSLFVSAVFPHSCSHHQIQAEGQTASCHKHSAHQKNNSNEQIKSTVSETRCTCLQPAVKFVAKSEINKFAKQFAAVSLETPLKIAVVSHIIADETQFSKPLYLSDSFYNLSPGRAPPVL